MREKLKHAYTTERLVLAPVTIDDAPDMFEYDSNPENAVYVFETHKTLGDNKDNFTKIFIENGLGQYGIFLNEKLIGNIVFLNLDDRKQSAELSYVRLQKFEGHGYDTEADIQLRDIFFNELEGERLYARHTFEHSKSMNHLDRIGMKIEGTLRKTYCLLGRTVDLDIWYMTRDDL